MRRKLVALLLSIACVSTGITGCGASSSSDIAELEKKVDALTEENESLKLQLKEQQQTQEDVSEVGEAEKIKDDATEKEKKGTPINIGDTITTSNEEVVINSVDFSYKVEPKSGSGGYYSAKSGKVYIAIDTSIKNLQKSDLKCDEAMKVTADYNGGYSYSAFSIIDSEAIGLTDSFMSSINPLETMEMKYLIDCPEEVATSDAPLIISFSIDGQDYNYQMR